MAGSESRNCRGDLLVPWLWLLKGLLLAVRGPAVTTVGPTARLLILQGEILLCGAVGNFKVMREALSNPRQTSAPSASSIFQACFAIEHDSIGRRTSLAKPDCGVGRK